MKTKEECLLRESLFHYRIPEHMHDGAVNYLLHYLPPGDFMTALLSNDLMEAFGRADAANIRAMGNWVRYVYNAMPFNCHGSYERVKEWLSRRQVAEVPSE